MNPLDLETYGYPKVIRLGKNENGVWIRLTHGWFFPDVCEGENAMYYDEYINDKGEVILILDDGTINFDFWTPLKDYEMGFISGTIAENFKIPKNVQVNEIEV